MTTRQPDQSPGEFWNDDPEFNLPEDSWPLPKVSYVEKTHAEPTTGEFVAMSKRPEYTNLRSTFRNFAFPMTIAGLVSYFTYVVLSIYAVDFMAKPLFGTFSIGMTLGLFQFAVVYVWTAIYVNFANKKLDPVSGALKDELEKGAQA